MQELGTPLLSLIEMQVLGTPLLSLISGECFRGEVRWQQLLLLHLIWMVGVGSVGGQCR
jgi:hypothetical protein